VRHKLTFALLCCTMRLWLAAWCLLGTVSLVHALPSVVSTPGVRIAPQGTVIAIQGTSFDSSASVVLSATSGTISQPASVTAVSSTLLAVTVAALNSDLDGAVIKAVVTTTAGSSGSATSIGTVGAACPDAAWSLFDTHCYKVQPSQESYSRHLTDCQAISDRTHSVTIHSEEENNFLTQLMVDAGNSGENFWTSSLTTYDFYIGGTLSTSAMYAPWKINEPNEGYRPACVRITTTGEFMDRSCSSSYDTACEVARPSGGSCSSGWSPFAGSCYRISTQGRSWSSARAWCQGQDAVRWHGFDLRVRIPDPTHFIIVNRQATWLS